MQLKRVGIEILIVVIALGTVTGCKSGVNVQEQAAETAENREEAESSEGLHL